MKRVLRWGVVGLIAAFLAIQLIPYGRAHSNPPPLAQVQWDSPQTRELFTRACADCHSFETVWPWYGHVAPVSWLVQRDVDLGRAEFNVSDTRNVESSGEDAAETIQDGSMPLGVYLLTHPEARLSSAERQTLANGLLASLGGEHDSDTPPEEEENETPPR
jgi:hypothetical protein